MPESFHLSRVPAATLTPTLSSPRSHLQARVRILVDGSLLLQRATPDDAGKYTCVASNGLWKPPSASAFVTVLCKSPGVPPSVSVGSPAPSQHPTCLFPPPDPAQVTTMLPETHLPKGMRGVIRCPTRANPPLLSVSWTRDGCPLELGKVRPPTAPPPPHLHLKSPPRPSHQLPGWSARPDGSIVIATGNDDALGVYTCTPYNSYGTAGASRPTRVLLKVGADWGGDRGHNTPVSLVPATVPSTVRGSCRTPPPSPCAPRRNISRRWAGS